MNSVFPPDGLESRDIAHAEAMTSGKLFYESRVIWPDKSVHWARVEGKVYYDVSSKPIRILGTLLDIIAQKQAKEDQ